MPSHFLWLNLAAFTPDMRCSVLITPNAHYATKLKFTKHNTNASVVKSRPREKNRISSLHIGGITVSIHYATNTSGIAHYATKLFSAHITLRH